MTKQLSEIRYTLPSSIFSSNFDVSCRTIEFLNVSGASNDDDDDDDDDDDN